MIYSQTFFSYLLAAIFTLLLAVRMKDFLKLYFENSFAWIVSLTVIFHPFSIEAFLAPNPLSGPLAFLLFFEAQFFFLNEKYHKGILALLLASLLNINFYLLPVFYFYKYRSELKNIRFPVLIYLILVSMYVYQHTLDLGKNPIIFLSHFIQNIFLPLDFTIFDYSFYPFEFRSIIFALLLLAFFIWQQFKLKLTSIKLWPLIVFPSFGILIHQWVFKYQFWDEVIFYPSNFMCITFAIITMMALYLPRAVFYSLSVISLAIAIQWTTLWYPLSSFIQVNIANLPANYSELKRTKRVLAWEYLYEKKLNIGEDLLRGLAGESPKDPSFKKDLEIFYIEHPEKASHRN